MADLYKSYQHGLIYAGAPHTEKKLSQEECRRLMKEKGGYFIRNIHDFDCGEPTNFWFIIKDKFGGIEELQARARTQTRKALKTLDIRPVSIAEILRNGYNVYVSSFQRYRDIDVGPMSEKEWKQYVSSTGVEYEYWGAFTAGDGMLIAYVENLIQDDMCKYTALKAVPEFLNKYYPFYGLLFKMNEYYLTERKLKYVTDGARSITEHSNIQSFLDKFGFRKAYCKLNIVYSPPIGVAVNVLYPFRKIIPFRKLSLLLKFEAMKRGKYPEK